MKIKVAILIVGAALMTVSFASVDRSENKTVKSTEIKSVEPEPAGGFIMERGQ